MYLALCGRSSSFFFCFFSWLFEFEGGSFFEVDGRSPFFFFSLSLLVEVDGGTGGSKAAALMGQIFFFGGSSSSIFG